MDLSIRISNELKDLKKKYPRIGDLKKVGSSYEVIGEIDLVDPDNNRIWETYKIKIRLSRFYPYEIPLLFELSYKISRTIDNHISENGECCLATRVEEKLILGKDYTLSDYVQKLVIPFLASQKLVDLGQERPNGEYSHHGLGILEYYKEKFNTNNIELVLNSLKVLTGEYKIIRNHLCYCGSLIKFKKCHEKTLKEFNIIDRQYIKKDLRDIEKYLESSKQ